MDKKVLRKKYKELRQQFSFEEIDDKSIAIANKLIQMPIWQYTYYHLYLTIEEQKEVDTSFILSILHGKDKEVVVSKSNFENHTLTHILLTENTRIQKNTYQIPEPVNGLEVPVQNMEVVFVPLLAFDIKGNRIGYGKGFYDRFLADCKPETIKIGLSLFPAEESMIDCNETDITLDFCITPEKIYQF
ncbi:5-formyltetrahydrofolate cyclo-ligase [Zhouia sp. PK063]|uniref:5-formyltetrahydrofolate cyclo-ligase n=1 Tax=Zhouia sp. PK063 TaxID=3373602 RepID=UPI00378F692F